MAYMNEWIMMAAPYIYGMALVLGYQLLRSQKRKLLAFG
jgi:hypothetical protein